MGTKRYIILFLYVLVICVFAGSTVAADTVIPYSLNSGWIYEADYPETLELTENPAGGIIVSIDVPTGIDEGGLKASRHDLTDYSLHNHGFIQLEYSSFSSEITGNPEGLDLCLEIEFYDADDVFYEMGIWVSQDAGGSFFQTWFQARGGSFYYYETPVPDGLSIAEGALGLYSDGSLVLPYFMDAAGSVLYPFAAWDVSGISGIHEYSVDNDFEGAALAGGTIIASVNLERVVYGLGPPTITMTIVEIDIKPDTLNLKSKGVFTAFIELPEGYGEEDVDIGTVECEGAPAVKAMMADDNKLIVKFNREDLVGVSPGDAVVFAVTGMFTDGTCFTGTDTVKVKD